MDDTPGVHADDRRALDRRILSLAVPALGALVAEPLFVLIDSAVVGHLGTAELAGLTLASTVLVTIVAVFVFLAYATTGAVARRLGAGDTKGALAVGLDGIWLALGLGVATLAVAVGAAEPIVTALGASAEVVPQATAYLRASAPGIPGMLVVLAATGALRGLQDTRTPLVVAVVGAVVNTIGSITLVYGFGMGIAGSGLATALTQLGMGAVLAAIVLRGARARGVGLRPHPAGILANARAGTPLLIRTLTLRAAILITVATATRLGDATLAAHQIVNAIWVLTAFALDALAIAAQALVGHALGARNAAEVRSVIRRCLQWGTAAGAAMGVLIAGLGWLVTPLFTSDPQVQRAAAISLVVIGLLLPLAAWPFVLDGVLMGAGDGRFLAWAGVLTLVVYLPLVGAVWLWAPDGAAGLAWLWAAFAGGFVGARALTTGLRARGTAWMVLGA
ncbi:MATE family efflux transporter [Occultella glacieicola]|uniref:MATE family efflux transporter n=1 Tax=Occultella glacieicola TaxID=2518684 RepID=A0ABY2E8E4_9MICO|nr:MATE family efflux transporter [Occultella glacieicola]TDE98786.1 MATE family efflux transporter [Occultella glacieicola]